MDKNELKLLAQQYQKELQGKKCPGTRLRWFDAIFALIDASDARPSRRYRCSDCGKEWLIEQSDSGYSMTAIRNQPEEPEQGEGELIGWLEGEYVALGHAAGMYDPSDLKDVEHSEKLRKEQRIIQRIKHLLQQKREVWVTEEWLDETISEMLYTSEVTGKVRDKDVGEILKDRLESKGVIVEKG